MSAFKLDEAMQRYTEAMQLDPEQPLYPANRSAALFEAGLYADSLADIEGAFERHPGATLGSKLALRACKCALWLCNYEQAQEWLQHDNVLLLSDGQNAISEQAQQLQALLQACRDSAKLRSAALSSFDAQSDAEAPRLLRHFLRDERGGFFAFSHDHPKSLLAGACCQCDSGLHASLCLCTARKL